jgi:hypothetical protein
MGLDSKVVLMRDNSQLGFGSVVDFLLEHHIYHTTGKYHPKGVSATKMATGVQSVGVLQPAGLPRSISQSTSGTSPNFEPRYTVLYCILTIPSESLRPSSIMRSGTEPLLFKHYPPRVFRKSIYCQSLFWKLCSPVSRCTRLSLNTVGTTLPIL